MPALLEVNPILAAGGQIAAIIICLFVLIFVLVVLAFNLAMEFGLSWVREKVELIKLLRPTVDSVNQTTEAAIEGVPPTENENAVVRVAASVPGQVQTIDKKVEQASDRVAQGVIEFRARTLQVQAIVKTFFGAGRKEQEGSSALGMDGREVNTPEPSWMRQEQVREIASPSTPGDGYTQSVHVSQLKDANSH